MRIVIKFKTFVECCQMLHVKLILLYTWKTNAIHCVVFISLNIEKPYFTVLDNNSSHCQTAGSVAMLLPFQSVEVSPVNTAELAVYNAVVFVFPDIMAKPASLGK